jgi:hypothetical protein
MRGGSVCRCACTCRGQWFDGIAPLFRGLGEHELSKLELTRWLR